MQVTLFSRILQAMENPWVVLTLTLAVLVVRQLYAGHRKRHPLPAGTPAPPRDPALTFVEGGILLLMLGLTGFELVAVRPVVVGGIFMIAAAEMFWSSSRKAPPPARSANVRKRGKNRTSPSTSAVPVVPHKTKDLGLEIIDTLMIALILVFGIVRPFLLQTFFIPSSSMEPTLLGPYNPAKADSFFSTVVHGKKARGGDKLIANKFIYRFRAPQRGEIVVFRPPDGALIGNNPDLQSRLWIEQHPGQLHAYRPDLPSEEMLLAQLPRVPKQRDDYIKRVIGIPGDRIRIVAGEGVYMNGGTTPITEPYLPGGKSDSLKSFPQVMPEPPPGADAQSWYWYEYLYKRNIKPYMKNGNFIVPPDSVFVMGDNRSEGGSFDSRYWGVVPIKDVKARAVSTFWPFTRLKLL